MPCIPKGQQGRDRLRAAPYLDPKEGFWWVLGARAGSPRVLLCPKKQQPLPIGACTPSAPGVGRICPRGRHFALRTCICMCRGREALEAL